MHRRYCQTTLSRNDHGQLILGDRIQATCAPHIIVNQKATGQVNEHGNVTNEAYIFRLPDELLMSIIEITSYDSPNRFQSHRAVQGCIKCGITCDYKYTTALSLVSRRFARIAQPFVFRAVGFGYRQEMVPASVGVRKLYHALRGNSSLRTHIKCIFLYVPDYHLAGQDVGNWRILKYILTGLTNLRCLDIHGGFEARISNEQMFTLIRNLSSSSQLVEHLALNREGWGLYLDAIMKNVQFPRLRSLTLHGISEYRGGMIPDLEVCRFVLHDGECLHLHLSLLCMLKASRNRVPRPLPHSQSPTTKNLHGPLFFC